MKLPELIKISNRNLFRSKMRTLLTVLPIFVGAFTLVLTNDLGDDLRVAFVAGVFPTLGASRPSQIEALRCE